MSETPSPPPSDDPAALPASSTVVPPVSSTVIPQASSTVAPKVSSTVIPPVISIATPTSFRPMSFKMGKYTESYLGKGDWYAISGGIPNDEWTHIATHHQFNPN
jgi:hypothetical protein